MDWCTNGVTTRPLARFVQVALVLALGCGDGGSGQTGGTGGFAGNPSTGGTSGIPGGCLPCNEEGAELADNGCDDNCNGLVDEQITCDSQLTVDGDLALNAARAMDLCEGAETEDDWGIVSVSYELPGGEAPPDAQMTEFALGHGLLDGFGTSTLPRAGLRLLALSSGTARDANDPGYQPRGGFDKGYLSSQPSGFPLDIPACDVSLGDPHDGIALAVEIRVPPNASGFAFDHAFYTADFPDLVCSDFSDAFTVIADPAPAGVIAGNLPLDDQSNPISVNSSFIDACACDLGPPCDAGGLTYACDGGTAILANTGYETGASTGWLTTSVAAAAGSEIRLRFAIWDSGDGLFDSTVIIDGFRWLDYDGEVATSRATP